jgi:hypothetical protein
MNKSASVVSSAFWLPEPAVEVGWERPKTKPVQTEVEARLWRKRRKTRNAEERQNRALIYAFFAGSSGASVAYALRSIDELIADNV